MVCNHPGAVLPRSSWTRSGGRGRSWGTREAIGMKAIPRRLLVLGGGLAGVDRALTVRRLGDEVALVEAAERVLDREPAPLGEALGEVLRRDGVEFVLGV